MGNDVLVELRALTQFEKEHPDFVIRMDYQICIDSYEISLHPIIEGILSLVSIQKMRLPVSMYQVTVEYLRMAEKRDPDEYLNALYIELFQPYFDEGL